jgi:molybdenum cofactor cytidylyltransferase
VTHLGALVLSAGKSSRLPRFKPLLHLGGKTLLARAAELFRQAAPGGIFAVTGCRAEEVAAEARACGLRTVHNPRYQDGMFTSLVAGLNALGPGCDGVFVLPVDIPLVRQTTVRTLVEAFEKTDSQVLLPTFRGQPGHPPLIRTSAIPGIVGWAGPDGLAGALANLHCEPVPVADAQILFDVDDDATFAEAEARLARCDIPTREEALALLDLHQAGTRGHAHGQGVADVALALARALNARGLDLDLELVESAALLHDIAKGQPSHEKVGGELLASIGFARVAEIVAAHRDIDPAGLSHPSEREVVYLADKLVRGAERIPVPRRFQEKLDHYAGDKDACQAIHTRKEHALAMQRLVETCAGMSLQKILL